MRIAHDVLARYIEAPEDPAELRALLDDCGLEVKRAETDAAGRTVFTLELLANRGDHHCYEGVATELNGRLGTGVNPPPIAMLPIGDGPWPVRCETDKCLVYTLTMMEKHADGALSADDLRPLEAAGIHSLTPPVDATNLANLEVGQPTHAFDADAIDGAITVRLSRAGETAWPLFRADRIALPEGTLVIADDSKILAIAGVIGCEESKTTEATTRLLIESATFDPVAVRKASRALGLHTDSSARFERGADPARPLDGAGRVVKLLEGAGWRRSGRSSVVGSWKDPDRSIALDVDAASRFLGVGLTPMEAADYLGRFGFGFGTSAGAWLHVMVPPRRLWDVAFAADLYEELAKAIGYNATPIALPPVQLGAVPSAEETRKRRAEDVLIGAGFYEVFTDGFYGRQVREQLGLTPDHPLWTHVETTNAIERNYALLKNNALAQAVECVAANARMRNPDVRAYEWTRTFHPAGPVDGRRHGPCTERKLLWAIASGRDRARAWDDRSRPADPWFLKGLVRELAVELRLPLTVGPEDPDYPITSLLHPGRRAAIRSGDRVVGALGEVHPAICRAFKLKRERPAYLEIDTQALLSAGSGASFAEPADWHPIVRSLAFALPHGLEAGRITEALRAAGPEWLDAVRITDLFEVDGARAITWELVFDNAPEAKRSAEQVNDACAAMAGAVDRAFGERGVRQR